MADKTVAAADPALAARPDVSTNPLAPATQAHPSGAMVEPEILTGVDTAHPAIDDNPRKGLPPQSYQIDLNDPTLDGQTAVRKNLEAQGSDAGGKPEAAKPDDKKA